MSEEQEIPEFNKTRPYGLNTAEGRISTYDQSGHLYDGLTLMPLSSMDKEKYAIPEGAPFSKVKSTQEKIEDAINTIRASGAVDADALANFDRMFRNMLLEKAPSSTSKPQEESKGFRSRKIGEETQQT